MNLEALCYRKFRETIRRELDAGKTPDQLRAEIPPAMENAERLFFEWPLPTTADEWERLQGYPSIMERALADELASRN